MSAYVQVLTCMAFDRDLLFSDHLGQGRKNMNKIDIIGRVTKDPEVRKTQSGRSVTTVGVAVDRPKKKNNATGKYEDAGADFFNVQLWDASAEFAGNYAHKGTLVGVSGRMTSRQYQAKDGSNRIAWEITDVKPVQGFEVLSQPQPKNQGEYQPQGNQQQYAPQAAPAQSSPSELDPSDFFGNDPFGNSY